MTLVVLVLLVTGDLRATVTVTFSNSVLSGKLSLQNASLFLDIATRRQESLCASL